MARLKPWAFEGVGGQMAERFGGDSFAWLASF
jgi:hypothetical protein